MNSHPPQPEVTAFFDKDTWTFSCGRLPPATLFMCRDYPKGHATLDMPRLILPSLQVNMRAGHLPPVEDNGMHYLKIPINAFRK